MDTTKTLANSSTSKMPAQMVDHSRAVLARAASSTERAPTNKFNEIFYEIPSDRAPTQNERAVLANRKHELQGALRGGEPRDVKRLAAQMIALFATGGMDAETSLEAIDDYAKVLSGQPLWAIESACRRVLNGGATFRPPPVEFLGMVRHATQPFRVELATLVRVLDARIYQIGTGEIRSRIRNKFEELRAKISPSDEPKRTPQQWFEKAKETSEHSRKTPLVASELLLRSLAEKG